MKGVIVSCLKELVVSNFGQDKWEASLEAAGFYRKTFFPLTLNVKDEDVLKIVGGVCKVLNITLEQAADAFGEHWVCKYASRYYRQFFDGIHSSRAFLLNMNNVHEVTTKNIPDARPPHFAYVWLSDNILLMKYKSPRGLIDFFVGLVRGVGKYFHENLEVYKVGNNKVRIIFPVAAVVHEPLRSAV